MRRVIAALVVGTLVFAAVYASASSLSLVSKPLQAGNAAVTACDTSFTFSFTLNGSSQVTQVTVGGIARPACTGGQLSVTLTDNAGAGIGSGGPASVPSGSGDASVTVPIAPQPNVANVKHEQVAIAGP